MIQRSVLAEPGNQALHHVHDKLTVCRCQPGKKVMEPAGLVLRAGALGQQVGCFAVEDSCQLDQTLMMILGRTDLNNRLACNQ